MEASRDDVLAAALRGSDMNVPDGVPIVWGMRALGAPEQERVFGPTLMWEVCRSAAESGIPIALFGSTEDTLTILRRALISEFAGLMIVAA
ncbi:MAG: WecB/TagA/CpsF family glycosyltransferase, partial [Actinobacteria bacterium]|nr:WecB/TagA/CpsF family glycosyltransferase [Actinomycetota bacterium]